MKYYIIVLLNIASLISFAQQITVIDQSNGEAVIGALISISDDSKRWLTDENGIAKLDNLSFPATVIIEYIGYKSQRMTLLNADDLVVKMGQSDDSVLDLVTVTASKYEVNLAEAPVSIDIIQPSLLRSVNASSADEILNKVPGVQILDGQANIRGGSGYSYGAGSRVMLLIDDMPALQADAGFPNWNDIPIENLSQIEIVKGAASTLYGSAALNGIINYRTTYATSEAETRVSISGTYIGSPQDEAKKWWGDSIRHESNIAIVHKKKYGKLDVVGSVFANRLLSHNQFTGDKRLRVNANLRYRPSERFSFGVNTIVNSSESNSFFIWRNPGSGAMQALSGTVSDRNARRIYIDPTATYIDKRDNKHRFLSRLTSIDNQNNTNQSNKSLNQYAEYQFQRQIEKYKLGVSAGIVGSVGTTDSQILGDTTFKTSNGAMYLQLDKRMKDLIVNAGIRYEYNRHDSPISLDPNGVKEDSKWIGRLSANQKVADYTHIRASYGQGYRFPTLTERFVTTTFGSFSIFSNPTLEPETGWSSEVGVKQGFKLGGFKGYLDMSAFWSEYDEMIEFTFVFENTRLGFQPQNVGDTRIRGLEFGVFGQACIGSVPINLLGGYTWLDPIYKNYDTSEQIRNSVSAAQNFLKYRSRHLAKIDAEADFSALVFKKDSKKQLRLGWSTQYASHVINIDKAFEAVPQLNNLDIFGIGQYREFNNQGFVLADLRLAFGWKKATFTFLVNNVLNDEYVLRPALIEPPRSYALRWDQNF
jgi:outer membrane receptor protein involved in Fe transport